MKADFTHLTGDDIRALAGTPVTFLVHDEYAVQVMTSAFTTGKIAFYGELKSHKPATNLGVTSDVFHTVDARRYCSSVVRRDATSAVEDQATGAAAAAAVMTGARTGGSSQNDSEMKSIQKGGIAAGITTGGDTNPEIFVDGVSKGYIYIDSTYYHEYYQTSYQADPIYGEIFLAPWFS
ncbi:hypothetical protein NWJ04_004850 [Salmonella enterica]|nr:hypothetical protein [Salmonella enterica]